MFSTARCFLPAHPSHPRLGATAPSRRTPSLTAVWARARRGGPRRDRPWDEGGSDDEDVAGARIDERFFGGAQDEEEPEEGEEPPERWRGSPAPEPAGQLRGSDVLRALQRAAAAKEAERRKKRAGARPASRQKDKGGGGVKAEAMAGEVRPIEIRREWATRIRELEMRVQQLRESTTNR